MPNTKRKVKFCKKLAAGKKTKTSNQKIKSNVANIETFNDNNDMGNLDVKKLFKNATEEDLEELSSNEAEEELTNNEIDGNFEWFDNGIEENSEHIYVPKAFNSISLKQIRKYARRATRFMECYRKGLTVLQAEYIVKNINLIEGFKIV